MPNCSTLYHILSQRHNTGAHVLRHCTRVTRPQRLGQNVNWANNELFMTLETNPFVHGLKQTTPGDLNPSPNADISTFSKSAKRRRYMLKIINVNKCFCHLPSILSPRLAIYITATGYKEIYNRLFTIHRTYTARAKSCSASGPYASFLCVFFVHFQKHQWQSVWCYLPTPRILYR